MFLCFLGRISLRAKEGVTRIPESSHGRITIFDFKEGQLTLLTHALHQAPSACCETWSGCCSLFLDRAAGSRDYAQHARSIVNYEIAREDAVRFRRLTAAHGCARLRDALSGACGKSGHVSRTVRFSGRPGQPKTATRHHQKSQKIAQYPALL